MAGPQLWTSWTAYPHVVSDLELINDAIDDLYDLAHAVSVNVKAYGAVGDGVADDTAATQAAIDAAWAAGGGEVYLPPGIYKTTSSLALKSNVHLVGAGRALTTIRPTSAVTTAVLLGFSVDTVTALRLAHFTIDGQYGVTAQTIGGIQITNGSHITIDSLGVTNQGGVGILLQGLGSGGGTPNSTVRNCVIDGTGLSDGTTGFGIIVKDASSRCKIIDNTVLNVKGGMGIGMNGSGGTGYPTFGTIARNTIDMQNSATGFEAIGITAGCTNTNIVDNNIVHSYDNGISVSAANCVVVGNNVDMSYNHGISSAGNYNVITGNRVRNPGQQADAAYGGIALTATTGNTVVGNVIYDDQGTPTMSHGVKLITSGGGNRVGPNYNHGSSVSGVLGALSTDLVIDSAAFTDGYASNKAYFNVITSATGGSAMQISGDARAVSRFWVGADATGNGQLNVFTNAASTRPNVNFCLVAGQTADLWQALAADNTTVLANMGTTGRIGSSGGFRLGVSSGPTVTTGTGTPEGAVTASVGSLFLRSDGGAGTTLYVKESGSSNTGWVAK